MKEKNNGFFKLFFRNKSTKIWFSFFVILTAIVVAASCVINSVPLISVTLDQVFGGQALRLAGNTSAYQYYAPTSAEDAAALSYYSAENGINGKSDAYAAAKALNETVCEEGFVLLKNEGGALPIETPESSAQISEQPKVTVLGKSSVNLVYGSTGSGGSDHTGAKTIYDSLSAAGYACNPTMKAFYESSSLSGAGRKDNADMEQGVSVGLAHGETPADMYGSEQIGSFAEYGDAAIVVISRIGGEGWDLPRTMKKSSSGGLDDSNKVEGAYSAEDHYLELDEYEQELLELACSNFDKVVVVINSSTPMELGFLDSADDNDPTSKIDGLADRIQAAVWIGAPGNEGVMALGRLLNGSVNPSGRLVDTYERDMTQSPTWQNFSTNLDDNDDENGVGDEYLLDGSSATSYYYVDYEEGIYVGYRYYETRAFTDGDEWYGSQVVYPFGYGLSYSDFDWEIAADNGKTGADKKETTAALTADMLESDDDIVINVKVTNKASSGYAGKDVVQVYVTAPYTDGGIEKSQVVLAGYAKTGLLAPGESEIVTVEFSPYSIASYDYDDANGNGHTGYELDKGEYTVSVGTNAHTALRAEPTMQKSFTISETNDGKGIAYNYDSEPDGAEGNTVTNQFDDVSFGTKASGASGSEASVSIAERSMSRSDWAGTFPDAPAAADREIDQEFYDSLNWSWSTRNDEAYDYYTEEMPVYAETASGRTQIQLHELIGLDRDDPLWDDFLDQLTMEEMTQLIGMGCYSTIANLRIGLPSTTASDGPVGLVNFFANMVDLGQSGTVYDVCSYASSCVMAATWNDRLAYEEGVAVGNECIIGDEAGDQKPYTGWYAPAVNIHRSPFSGRNSEYYSEDGLLAGSMAANVVKGASQFGVYTMVKHFAVNDQETHRSTNGISVWVNEQAMREIYLRPFQITVEDGESIGVMSSFNRLGAIWTGGSRALLTDVLRDEWGFDGMVITDFNTDNTSYMNVDQMIRAGGDLDLAQDKEPSLVNKRGESRLTATQASLIREAAHNILYVLANSNVMNGIGDGVTLRMGLSPWQRANVWIAVGIEVLLLAWGAFVIVRMLKKEKRLAAE